MTHITSDQRKAMLIEYEQLSRERNGINPKLSTYQKITARMEDLKKRLGEYEDPEEYARTLRSKRNKKRKKSILRRQATQPTI